MGRRIESSVFFFVVVLLAGVTSASAQSLGVYRWQVQPYCNVVSLAVTQVGGVYRLEGTDDQCGAATQASVIGTAFPNANGSIGFGLNIVAAPGGVPTHVDATITLPGLSGTWRDSAGASGSFVFTPGAGIPGSPRTTAGSVGAAAINPAQVQLRVTGTCPGGQTVQAINQDGSVGCAAGNAGDVTSVTAGAGLTGGGAVGDLSLAVNFGGPGAATTVARSDHTHAAPLGTYNTRVGNSAGGVAGDQNTAIGQFAMSSAANTHLNTAVGSFALSSAIDPNQNTAIGAQALRSLTSGDNNIAIGAGADSVLESGSNNITIGVGAGGSHSGVNNIYLGYLVGSAVDENQTIRIGNNQSSTYIKGISGQTSASGVAVLVNAQGKLGTTTSSRRFKQDIESLTDVQRTVQALRPVRFLYRPEFDDGGHVPQYGLIAEEVADVAPDLVVRGADGQPDTVRYHFLPPLLLAEVQRLERERANQERRLSEQEAEIAELRAIVIGMKSSARTPH
jgi:hypothetical protein